MQSSFFCKVELYIALKSVVLSLTLKLQTYGCIESCVAAAVVVVIIIIIIIITIIMSIIINDITSDNDYRSSTIASLLVIYMMPNYSVMPSVCWHCWLVWHKEHSTCKNWVVGLSVWSGVQIICTWSSWCQCHRVISCFFKIQIGLTFLVPAYPGCSEIEAAVKRVFVLFRLML